jgi:hypothetical protein
MSNQTSQPAAEPGDMLEIPSNIHLSCPLVPGKLRRLELCVSCEHGGRPLLVDRFGPGSEQPFAVRYMLRCKHPRSLQLAEVDVS